jgi:phytoene dehydrogenase-like protein
MRRLIVTAALAAFWAPAAVAGPIEQACRTSGRPQATLALCACIQQAANGTLSRADQRRAVRFFRDPHKAQEVRQSSRPADSAFWQRYRTFGETAELRCGMTG